MKLAKDPNLDYIFLNSKNGYLYLTTKTKKMIALHRYLMDAGKGQLIDHVDRNKKNNELSNLRLSNKQLNSFNSPKTKRSKTKYKGAACNTACSTFTARCGSVYLGSFETQEEAAVAYDAHAYAQYGDNVVLNFPRKKTA